MQVYRELNFDSASFGSTVTEDTLSSIDLSNPLGNYCNMQSANDNRSFVVENAVNGGWAKVLFNTTNPPEIAGASLENGSEFVEGTDMYLLVYSDADGIKYFYLKVVPNFPLEIVPKESEYVDLSGALDLSVPGACSITNYGTLEEATWDYELDYTRDWSLTFSGSESGLGVPRNTEGLNNIQLIRVSDDAIVIDGDFRTLGQTRQFLNMGGQSIPSSDNTFEMAQKLEIRNVGGSIFMYNNDVLLGDSGVDLTENVRLKLSMDDYNVYDLKLVYL